MIHFDIPRQKSSIIKVLGVGGGGSNAVNFMFAQDVEGVDFIICNTDSKALEQSPVPNKIQLGPHLTQGLGAGANPEVGKQATEESLDEIRRILELNTKMAFITVGMGGGTGTGGAPIIAKICRELGILTVGIVTTPFAFEGPRRLAQAEAGIRTLQPYVDTLLVISNDKLRMQYGNLKMTEAFSKADNILATAATCITDIINSKGTIIVDFADVCTVMKNGGVAILGSATARGENRAQMAIEEALSSPLLNDSDIRGAKWILVNINSAAGENECTMDEFEVINNYLRTQSGGFTDLIIGSGHDNTLEDKIGITLIATGFEHKDPFTKKEATKVKVQEKPLEEKIVMTLGINGEEKKMFNGLATPAVEKDPYAPTLAEDTEEEILMPLFKMEQTVETTTEEEKKELKLHVPEAEMLTVPPVMMNMITEQQAPIHVTMPPNIFTVSTVHEKEETKEAEEETPVRFELKIDPPVQNTPAITVAKVNGNGAVKPENGITYTERTEEKIKAPVNGFLNRPSNIYAEAPVMNSMPIVAETPGKPEVQTKPAITVTDTAEEEIKLQLHEVKEDETADIKMVVKHDEPKLQYVPDVQISEDDIPLTEEEEQKKRAAERISKLRNLSFNMNNNEANAEYDNVPAYVRRNMELFGNALTSVDQFYSKYTVKKDENEQGQISSLNTFLDGKKPD